MEIKLDMSAFYANLPEEMQNQQNQNPCENMQQQSAALTNTRCTFANGIVTITGQLDRSESDVINITSDTYRFDVKKALLNLSEESGDSEQSLPEPGSSESQQAKAIGMEYYYTVKMPGTVTTFSQGEGVTKVDAQTVQFDVLNLPENAFVESSSGTAFDPMLIAIIAVVVIIIVIAAYFLTRKK